MEAIESCLICFFNICGNKSFKLDMMCLVLTDIVNHTMQMWGSRLTRRREKVGLCKKEGYVAQPGKVFALALAALMGLPPRVLLWEFVV